MPWNEAFRLGVGRNVSVAFPTDCANNSLGLFGYPLCRNRNFNFTVEAEANVGSKSHPLLETSLREAQKPKHPDHTSNTHNIELDHFRHSNTKATKTRDFMEAFLFLPDCWSVGVASFVLACCVVPWSNWYGEGGGDQSSGGIQGRLCNSSVGA